MVASGVDEEHVKDISVPVMIDFGSIVEHIKLKLSPKAVIVTNETQFTKRLVELKSHNIMMCVGANGARDLGISHTDGSR